MKESTKYMSTNNPGMKAGSETGSLINHVYSRSLTPAPEAGMGATILAWTDRYAATIVKVTPQQIHVQRDIPTRVDTNGMSEAQEYTYAPNPEASIEVFRATKRGWRNRAGNGLLVGKREEYYDFSF